MGYYTKFRLETDSDTDALIGEWAELPNAEYGSDYVSYCLISEQESKWYEHKTHIEAFSLLHPSVTFNLMGEGENSGDIWKMLVRNGNAKYQKAKIVFEPLES